MTSHAKNYGMIPLNLYSGIENYGDGAGVQLKSARLSEQPRLGLNLEIFVPTRLKELLKLQSQTVSTSVPYYFRIPMKEESKLGDALGANGQLGIEHLLLEGEEFELELEVKIRRRVNVR